MSTLRTTNLQHASAASPAIVLASSGSATAQLSSINDGPIAGARNRIINGDMRIDQRNAGASVTLTATGYTVDRWGVAITQTSKLSVQRNAGSVTPPVGFTNYLGVTSLSAYTVVSSDVFSLYQPIEGFNFADLAFGSANARSITISFWVRSSLTGTFGGSIRNGNGNRSYPFSYTISASNTWEQKTVSIAGDTTGTWLTSNDVGAYLHFNLGAGSTYSGTAGSWQAGDSWSATGATSVVGTNGATFYITGVQLEPGSVATPFERRSYGQELMLAQRYYQKSYSTNVAPGTATNDGRVYFILGVDTGTRNKGGTVLLSPPMRTGPTLTFFNDAGTSGVLDGPAVSPTTLLVTERKFMVYVSTSASEVSGSWTASAEL